MFGMKTITHQARFYAALPIHERSRPRLLRITRDSQGREQMTGPRERVALFIPIWLVWITALGFVLGGLGSFGILDNNEGLYAEIAREMLASHDWRQWVIPHLNGLPYMEKPPLLYWLTALSFAL